MYASSNVFASSFSCVEAIALTPVESNTAFTDVAISLTVEPAAAVTDELPKIPCMVKLSDWTRLASLVLSTAYALSAKLLLSTALFAISVV